MTPDELKSMPKGSFIVAKTGAHPMKSQMRLFLDWGIRFGTPYEIPEKTQRPVAYADKQTLEENIIRSQYASQIEDDDSSADLMSGGISQSTKGNADSRRPRPVIQTQ